MRSWGQRPLQHKWKLVGNLGCKECGARRWWFVGDVHELEPTRQGVSKCNIRQCITSSNSKDNNSKPFLKIQQTKSSSSYTDTPKPMSLGGHFFFHCPSKKRRAEVEQKAKQQAVQVGKQYCFGKGRRFSQFVAVSSPLSPCFIALYGWVVAIRFVFWRVNLVDLGSFEQTWGARVMILPESRNKLNNFLR